MLTIMKNVLTVFALMLLIVSTTLAQQPPNSDHNDRFVTEKGFRSKVFDVKYREPRSLVDVLRPLLSGFKGAEITASTEFKTLTVRDFPENLATIEEAIKRLDTPVIGKPDIELHMHVLIGSNTGTSPAAAFPDDLTDVVTQLRKTLNFKNYELATSIVQRLKETEHHLQSRGTMIASQPSTATDNSNLLYEYQINSVSLATNADGTQRIQISGFSFSARTHGGEAKVHTALNMRDGEKVVVGTAGIKDKTLIVVLTARFIK